MDVFIIDLMFILIAATFLSIIARAIKQPSIPAYVLAGIIIGPIGFRLITDTQIIATFAEFGVALLLFVIGLEMNIKKLKVVGKASIFSGLLEVMILAELGFIAAVFLGFHSIEALYIGLIIAFSSTAVVLKVLSDKNEANTLHGRIMLGILLVQDIIVIFALSFLMTLNNFTWSAILAATINGVGMLAVAFIITRYILPIFFKKIAESEELLLLFAISWCFAFVGLSAFLNFSLSIGAFIAGVSLASFPYNIEIAAKIKPIRDFFVTIFFVSIGMQIVPITNQNALILIGIMILLALIIKPAIIMILSSFSGFSKRTSFLSGIGLAQISEFSIILATQGVLLGHITQQTLSSVIIVAVVSMTIATYIIKYDYTIYKHFRKILFFLKKNKNIINIKEAEKMRNHYVICGSDKIGSVVLETIKKLGKKYIVIDYDPEVIRKLMREASYCMYGDISDEEVLEKINLTEAKAIISTVPNQNDNIFLLNYLKAHKSTAKTFLTAESINDAMELYNHGASYVILPKVLSGEKFSDIIKHFMDSKIIEALRVRQINKLTYLKEDELLDKFAPLLAKYRDEIKRKISKNKN